MGNFCSLTGPFYFRTLFGHAVINRGIVGKLWNAYGISPRAQSALATLSRSLAVR